MEAARLAKDGGYDYFTTTLTVGPKKDARLLNQLGEEIGSMYGVAYLNSDFKKKNGHFRSLELSEQYGLYRQDYCGCVFSRRGGCFRAGRRRPLVLIGEPEAVLLDMEGDLR